MSEFDPAPRPYSGNRRASNEVGVSVLKVLLLGLVTLAMGLAAAIGVVIWWTR